MTMEVERIPIISDNGSENCDHKNCIEERDVLSYCLHESDSRHPTHVKEMVLLCQSKDKEISDLKVSYAESVGEISRLKSQIENYTLSSGVIKNLCREGMEGEIMEEDSCVHQSKERLQHSQEVHEQLKKEIATKRVELRKLLECIERKEKVVQDKTQELIKVMRTKNTTLLHLEQEITRAKKSQKLLAEKLAQGELKLSSKQQQIEHQEMLTQMKHENNSIGKYMDSPEPSTSLPLLESKECDANKGEQCWSINERAIRFCSSFRSNYGDMTTRISILVQQLKKIKRMLQLSLTEKDQISRLLIKTREKYSKQAKIIRDLKVERDHLLSQSLHSSSDQKAPRQQQDEGLIGYGSLHEKLTSSNRRVHFELAHLEKKHADIIQKNNWNKELKDFICEVLEYATSKEEELNQIKQEKDKSTKSVALVADPPSITSVGSTSELTSGKLLEELQMKERTILNLMEQLRQCQQKCSHLLEENQQVTSKNVEFSDRCRIQGEVTQQKMMELEMKNSNLEQLKQEIVTEKDILVSRYDQLWKDHESLLVEVEDLTQKLAVSDKDKQVLEGILEKVSGELVSVEQDRAELINSLEDLKRGSSHEERHIVNGTLVKSVKCMESLQKSLPDVCSSLTTSSNVSLHSEKESDKGASNHQVSIRCRQDHIAPPTSITYVPGVEDVLTVNSNNSSSVGLSPARIVPEPKSCVSGIPKTRINETKFATSSIRHSRRCGGFLSNLLICSLVVVLLLLLITVNISIPSSNFISDIFEPYFEHTKINNIY